MNCLLLSVLLATANASPSLNAKVSWLGNTFPGAAKWVQQDIASVAVTPDGEVYTSVPWDEAGGEVSRYKDGDRLGTARHTRGWGYDGGVGVAVNSKYVYFGQSVDCEGGGLKDPDTWPDKGRHWFGVSRRKRADFTQSAPFPGGKGGKGDTLRGGFLVVNDVAEGAKAQIGGLWATETQLFVSNPATGKVLVYDAETMSPVREWAVDKPGSIAQDTAGRLWVLRTTTPAELRAYSADGTAGAAYTFEATAKPTNLCADRGRLLVTDCGPSQQVRIIGDLDGTPREIGRFGVPGGIYAEPSGRVGPGRLNMPSALGVDAAGRVYVANDGQSGGGGTVLQCYEPDGKLVWELQGLTFVDVAAADPVNETDVFTKEERFRLDYSKPAGREATYAGYTINPFRYPDDPRLHLWSGGAWVRRIEGRRFLFVLDMNAEWLQVYRFDAASGETAIPSGMFSKRQIRDKQGWPNGQPARGEWIWRDANGNGAFDEGEYVRSERDTPECQGWWVDAKGNVWQVMENEGIRCLPMRGLDAKGNPTWDLTEPRTWPKPAEFAQLRRLRYDSATDTMILGGTTTEHKNQHWKPMGPVMVRYDKWSSAAPSRRWTLVAPYDNGAQGHFSCEPMGFDVAGDYLFVPYTGESKEMGYAYGHVEVFRLDDASPVGHMEPTPEIGQVGLQDLRETMSATRRPDGEYVIFLEDDYKSKTVMYRWKP